MYGAQDLEEGEEKEPNTLREREGREKREREISWDLCNNDFL